MEQSILPTKNSFFTLFLSPPPLSSGIPAVAPRPIPIGVSSLSIGRVISRRYWRSTSVQKCLQYPCRGHRKGRDSSIIPRCCCGGQTRFSDEVHHYYWSRLPARGRRSIAKKVSLQGGYVILRARGRCRDIRRLYRTLRERREGVVIIIIVIPAAHDDSYNKWFGYRLRFQVKLCIPSRELLGVCLYAYLW